MSNIAVSRATCRSHGVAGAVLEQFPDDEGALNDLGYLWADQNQHLERAKRMIEKAVAGEPENMAYRDSLGWVLSAWGSGPEAIAELEKAVAARSPIRRCSTILATRIGKPAKGRRPSKNGARRRKSSDGRKGCGEGGGSREEDDCK